MFFNSSLFIPSLITLLFFPVVLCDLERRYFQSTYKHTLWHEYKRQFNKHYYNVSTDAEHEKIFIENLAKILNHNLLFQKHATSYNLGLNKFSDKHNSKITNRFLTTASFVSLNNKRSYIPHNLSMLLSFPEQFSWRTRNILSPVIDQMECGACWAITAAGSLESIYNRISGERTILSPQELVDCSKENFGCQGGWYDAAFSYVASKPVQWLLPAETYPYVAKENEQCYNESFLESSVRCVGALHIEEHNEEAMLEALFTIGPLPVAISVTDNLFLYSEGVFRDVECVRTPLSHAVLLVGYGQTKEGHKFWELKNSWGDDWGDDGYFRLERGSNMCGVASYVYAPDIVRV